VSSHLKHLEFILENGECVHVDAERLDVVAFGKVFKSYRFQKGDPVKPLYFTDYCSVRFDEETSADSFYYPRKEHADSRILPLYRLTKGRDVTAVTLKFEDGTEQTIYVPWEDGFGRVVSFTNMAQFAEWDGLRPSEFWWYKRPQHWHIVSKAFACIGRAYRKLKKNWWYRHYKNAANT
jgi:hypothetical protein